MKRTNLRKNRQKNNLTQSQLAEKVKVTKKYISEIERGIRTPSLNLACRLEKILGIPVCELLKRDGDEDYV